MKQPLTFFTLPSKPLLVMVPLCSAPIIVLLVAGAVQVVPCWDVDIFMGYHNASIYLFKGGRLGLLPGVLSHSCHPSFRHIDVMFLDFASLT